MMAIGQSRRNVSAQPATFTSQHQAEDTSAGLKPMDPID